MARDKFDHFWARINITDDDNDCWIWQGCVGSDGYGQLKMHSVHMAAHRCAYMYAYGDLPDGKMICHHCDHNLCCNPKHLYAGTAKDNARDQVKRGRAKKANKDKIREYGGYQSLVPCGEDRFNSKLTDSDVRLIRSLAHNMYYREIAQRFNVSTSTIGQIVNNKIWRHVT